MSHAMDLTMCLLKAIHHLEDLMRRSIKPIRSIVKLNVGGTKETDRLVKRSERIMRLMGCAVR